MKNLFIIHTQYNLILATGLAETEFQDDTNDLILFHDFMVGEVHANCLKKSFSNYAVLNGNYPKKEISYKEKDRIIKKQNKEIKDFIQQHGVYDRLFIVDDMCIQEMYAIKICSNMNSNLNRFWLEDGANAYFSNGVESGGMGATPFNRLLRKLYFSTKYSLWGYYDLASCMGAHKCLESAYLTFPDCAREELAHKHKYAIADEAFHKGMDSIFKAESILFEENSLLIVMDKLDVYGVLLSNVNRLVENLVTEANKNHQKTYYKYHPRETDRLLALNDSIEIEKTVAFENYLTNSSTNDLTVIGFKSTALQTAKKMGYKTISFIKEVEPDNRSVLEFYRKIGIECY